jgi:transcriptional regulator with XRE-family HTH domain
MALLLMGKRDDAARSKVAQWLSVSKMTQTALAETIGRNQAWMSRYLDGEFDTDLETLEKIATAFNHSLFELLDTPQNSTEVEVIERWRALKPSGRKLVLDVLREWSPDERGRTRGRNGGK